MTQATYDPQTDMLTYTCVAGPHEDGFTRAAQLGAAGFTAKMTRHGTQYSGAWSPEGEKLLRALAGVIGDAHPHLSDGVPHDPNATRWEDPAYWQARARKAVALGMAPPEQEGTVRYQRLQEEAQAACTLATQALKTQRLWEAILPPAGQEASERFRLCVTGLLKDLADGDRLRRALDDGTMTPTSIASELITRAAALYTWAKRAGLHRRLRLQYFDTLAHPGDVRVDPAPQALLDLAAQRPGGLTCLIGFPDHLEVAGATGPSIRASDVTALGEDSVGRFGTVVLAGDRDPKHILQASRWVTAGGRLLTVCGEAFDTAPGPAWMTLRSMRELGMATTEPFDTGRLLLQMCS